MPGFCQLLTGLILLVGLTWFQVFSDNLALYLAALAFSAYDIHWFALGWNQYRGSDIRPNLPHLRARGRSSSSTPGTGQ
jgi:hypothetical protein